MGGKANTINWISTDLVATILSHPEIEHPYPEPAVGEGTNLA
jgi:hypothetical protein